MRAAVEWSTDLHCDVAVVGGGLAGVMAAVAAARTGADTILVERSASLGGIAVDGPLEALMTFHDARGPVVGGLPMELVERLAGLGGSPGCVTDTTGYCRSIVPYDAECLRLALFQLVREAGVRLLLQTSVVYAVSADSSIAELALDGGSGLFGLRAGRYVDATGDAVLAHLAGAACRLSPEAQPMTTLIRVGGVDTAALRAYVSAHRGDFRLDGGGPEDDWLHLWGFGSLLQAGCDAGRLSLRRTEMHAMMTPRPGEWVLNYTRCAADPLTSAGRTQGQQVTLEQAGELVAWLRDTLPPFAGSYLIQTGRIGIREGRQAVGQYELTAQDVLTAAPCPDPVALGAFPIDIHQRQGDSLVCKAVPGAYPIPARCLRSVDTKNLYLAGRGISASHEALASVRITATAMATGQAAGVMAALGEVGYAALRSALERQGALLRRPDLT